MNFAERIKELRKAKGLSQGALAESCGITARTLQNYEMGRRYPANLEIARRLAEALDTTPDQLLSAGEETIVKTASQDARRQLSSLVQAVTGLFAGGEIGEEDRDAAMEAIIAAYWAAKKENRKFAVVKESRK